MNVQDPRPQTTQGHVLRPARIALGWLTDDMAGALLNERVSRPAAPEQTERLLAARAAVASRPVGLDQTDAVNLNPPELHQHREVLAATAYGGLLLGQGWDIALVDLTRLRAYQPSVFIDSARERIETTNLEDMSALAELCLPTSTDQVPPPQFDPARNAFLVASPNPNLEIMGHGIAQAPDGTPLLGFLVAQRPSFLNVALYHGRYVLHDGYHRAVALLAAGRYVVPALVHEFTSITEMAPGAAGLLPEEAYLGERPPTPSDYVDDAVSTLAYLPTNQKIIVIQGLQLTPFG